MHLFGDVEYVKFDSRHRVGTGNPDPNSGNTTTTYNWTSKNEDDAWQVGIGAEWAVQTRLKLKASAIYAETDGHTDFTVEAGGTRPRGLRSASDDTTRDLVQSESGLRARSALGTHRRLWLREVSLQRHRLRQHGYVVGALNNVL